MLRVEDSGQRPLKCLGRRKTILPLLGESLQHDLLKIWTNRRVVLRRGRDDALLDLFERVEIGFSEKEPPARQHLIQNDAGGKDVRSRVDFQAGRLLGGHVSEFSFQDPGLRAVQFEFRLGNSEVDDFHLSVVRDHDVLRRDVPVNDVERFAGHRIALRVGVFEALEHFDSDEQGLGNAESKLFLMAFFEDGPKILSIDVFHRDKIVVADLAQIGDLANVGMRETDRNFRLVDEHLDELVVFGKVGQNTFDDEQPFEPADAESFGLEYFGHSADGDSVEEKVLSVNGGFKAHGSEVGLQG